MTKRHTEATETERQEEEDHRLDCLARYWISMPRKSAQDWLDKQQVRFRDDMRERMNLAAQVRRDNR